MNRLNALLLVSLVTASCTAGNPWRQDAELQAGFARRYVVGSRLQPTPRAQTVRDVPVRVWASPGYIRGKRRWKAHIKAVLDRANAYLAPTFGVRLHVQVLSRWDVEDTADLNALLRALHRVDPGDNVQWVIGFAPASSGAVVDFSDLGMATSPGKHFVVRATNDPEERAWIERNMSELSEEAKNAAHESRRAHKSTAIFLHEWAHTLGAMHTQNPNDLMAAYYDTKHTRFADLTVIDRGLRDRLDVSAAGPTRPGQTVATRVDLELLRIGITPSSPAKPDRGAYQTAFWDIYEALRANKVQRAKRRLGRARTDVPADGWHQVDCEIKLRQNNLGGARKACKRALRRFDGLPRAHYLLGVIEARLARKRSAKRHFRRTLAIDPDGPHDAARRLASLGS